MASLDQIMTHKYKPDALRELSEQVAEDCGEDWVTTESIQQYNAALDLNLNVIKKIIKFLFVSHPYIGFLCVLLLPPIILLPVALNAQGLTVVILGGGLFIGFVVGSFIFPNLVSSCKLCGSIRKSERIFTHCLEFEEYTEERYSEEYDVRYKYLVRSEIVFCIYECEKCKGRKIEILKLTKEKRL